MPKPPKSPTTPDTQPAPKSVNEMSAEELLNRDMNQVEWNKPTIAGIRAPRRNLTASRRAKASPELYAHLAVVRVGTQLGGPRIRRCTKISKSTGQRCGCVAITGYKVCWAHASATLRAIVVDRRRQKGAPVALVHRKIISNMGFLLRRQLIPLALMRQPVFANVLKVVVPTAFGLPRRQLGKSTLTQQELKTAAILCRELALAWINGEASGDWGPWAQAAMKARAAGYLE